MGSTPLSQSVMVFAGAVALSVVILVVFIGFLSPENKTSQREIILADIQSTSGIAPSPKPVRMSEMAPNSARYFAYPSSYDIANENAYRVFILIRLPEERGGGTDDVSSFRAYSALDINSHCLMKYWPQEGRKRMEDPCHGDIVRVEDGLLATNTNRMMSGVFVAQPYLDLSADGDGYLYVEPPIWDMDKNGVVGIGRGATQDEVTSAALRELEQLMHSGYDLSMPPRLIDGSVITPGPKNGQFLYIHPSDARIEHLVEVFFCNCSERGPEVSRGGQIITAWALGVETIYTDVLDQSDTPSVAVTFFRNGYEIVVYDRGFERTLDVVFDNFYKNMNRSMLQKVSELERM